jgi:hypothetical protein
MCKALMLVSTLFWIYNGVALELLERQINISGLHTTTNLVANVAILRGMQVICQSSVTTGDIGYSVLAATCKMVIVSISNV